MCQEIITAQAETEYGIYLETCPNPIFLVHISTSGALCIYVSGTYVGTCYTFLIAIEKISRLNEGRLIRDGMILLLVSGLVLIPVIIEYQ